MRDSTIFYRSFYEAIKELPAQNQADVYAAIFEYSLNFSEIKLTGLSKTIFTLIKPQLDANLKRFRNGSEPKTKQDESKTEAKPKRTVSKTEANNNNNVNNNKNLNENNNYNENLLADVLVFENACRIHNCTENGFKDIVAAFFTRQKADGKNWETYHECKKHFNNWLNKYIPKKEIETIQIKPKYKQASD